MATPVVVTLVVVAVATVLTLVALVVLLARSVGQVAGDLVALRDGIEPDLDALRRDVEVTRAELARLERTREGTPDEGPPPLPPGAGR